MISAVRTIPTGAISRHRTSPALPEQGQESTITATSAEASAAWGHSSTASRCGEWELSNIKEDRTEQHNLIGKYPEMAKELETAYFEWADKSDVLYFQKMWNTYNKNRRKDFKEYKTR